jgi:hypothetical protein
VRAGRDIIGGDVRVAGDSITGGTVTVQRGYSADQVQRLVLTVGGLVFATAVVFFIFGAITVSALLGAINRPVNSSIVAAEQMQAKIDALNSLQSGQTFRVVFTEDELSSYFRFILGPDIGVTDGKARLLDETGEIAISGNAQIYGGLPFIAQLSVTTTDVPFNLESAYIKVLPTPEWANFGWIPVTPLARNLSEQVNSLLFGQVQFTRMLQTGGGEAVPPPVGNNLVLQGVAK